MVSWTDASLRQGSLPPVLSFGKRHVNVANCYETVDARFRADAFQSLDLHQLMRLWNNNDVRAEAVETSLAQYPAVTGVAWISGSAPLLSIIVRLTASAFSASSIAVNADGQASTEATDCPVASAGCEQPCRRLKGAVRLQCRGRASRTMGTLRNGQSGVMMEESWMQAGGDERAEASSHGASQLTGIFDGIAPRRHCRLPRACNDDVNANQFFRLTSKTTFKPRLPDTVPHSCVCSEICIARR
jgi:hypothetical protein